MDKAVVKAFSLLELLAGSDDPMGVTRLAETSGLGKSNVHRLLQTLQSLGYVSQTPDGAYSASLKMWELGNQVMSRFSLRDVARPFMKKLSAMTKETVHLSELDGFEVLYIDKIESREPVRAYTQLGGRAPAYCTATGKAILAYASTEDIEECCRNAQAFTAKTIVHADRFLVEAEKIRDRKFALNRGEWRADVIGLAAPILDSTGAPIGAIGLSAPGSRLHIDEMETLAPRVVEYAREISEQLGCSAATWAGGATQPELT